MNKLMSIFLLLFIITPVWADTITQNVSNECNVKYLGAYNDANQAQIEAIWQPNSYTCDVGYFLPADGIECIKCSDEHICLGGTYFFNILESQGIQFDKILTNNFTNGCLKDYLGNEHTTMLAKWERHSYNCAPGYYLPADGIECVLCLMNNYCPGGTYDYSETMSQGIMLCPNELVSAPGMSEPGSCGRKFHVGDAVLFARSQKKTTPSLNFDVNADGVAEFFLNTTLMRTTINSTSSHYLHIGEYYLYDDTVMPK